MATTSSPSSRSSPSSCTSDITTSLFPPSGPQPKDVYELYGEEGSGKSQCLLHFVASYVLPHQWNGITLGGKDTGVIYIDNEYHFNILRLTVIMEQRIVKASGGKGEGELSDEALDTFIKHCLKKLYLVRCSSSSQMIITLHSLEPILKNKSIRILMIDSISAFYWIDRSNGAENTTAQEANLVKISSAIADLIDRSNLVVFASKPAIFVRKAKDEINDEPSDKVVEHCEYLCKAWQRMVTHRLIFSKNSAGHRNNCSFHVKSDSAKGGTHKIDRGFAIADCGLVFES